MTARKNGMCSGFVGVILLLTCAVSAPAQTAAVIYHFTGSGGLYPNGNLIFDAAGNLYGTTIEGGSCGVSSKGCGVAYELSPSTGGWAETVLHTFGGGAYGYGPNGGLVFDSKGNLYGTTGSGGAYGFGTVFELTPTQSGWAEQVLYSFTGTTDGGYPQTGVVLDSFGNIYGESFFGGANNEGLLYQLEKSSNSTWTYNVLLSFDAMTGTGFSQLSIDANGNLYGTASKGQYAHNRQKGIVFEVSPVGEGTWTANVIYEFYQINTTGTEPVSGVAVDKSGNLYGMTAGVVADFGGPLVYEVMEPSSSENILMYIPYGRNPSGPKNAPSGPVNVDALGNVYGVFVDQAMAIYGSKDAGTVFRVGPSGTASYVFPLAFSRVYPQGGLAVDAQGNAFGTTTGSSGEVFEITF